MERAFTPGSEPLDAAVVAFTHCGHWRVYPVRADPELMHELARFNLGIACSFCLAEWQAATRVPAGGTATSLN
jgi:hypothetical protein